MTGYLIGYLITLFSFFTLFYIAAQIKHDNSIVDVGWGLGFVVLAWYSFIYQSLTSELMVVQIVVTGLITLWGVRLFLHIGIRNFKKPEDFRYQKMRENWDHPYLDAFFRVFMLQAVLMLFVSAPIMAAYHNDIANTVPLWLIIAGGVLFMVGFFFEAVGDYQLRRFIKHEKKQGEVMTKGLWRYTRHPNYFGEVVMWWALWVIVLMTDVGIAALVSPLLITYLLLFVSGIPILEKRYEDNEAFQAYAKKTSIFFPLPPKE